MSDSGRQTYAKPAMQQIPTTPRMTLEEFGAALKGCTARMTSYHNIWAVDIFAPTKSGVDIWIARADSASLESAAARALEAMREVLGGDA